MRLLFVKLDKDLKDNIGFKIKTAEVKNITEKMIMLETPINYSSRIYKSDLGIKFVGGYYSNLLGAQFMALYEDNDEVETINEAKETLVDFIKEKANKRIRDLEELVVKIDGILREE